MASLLLHAIGTSAGGGVSGRPQMPLPGEKYTSCLHASAVGAKDSLSLTSFSERLLLQDKGVRAESSPQRSFFVTKACG